MKPGASDWFMAASGQRLGDKGIREASHAAHSGHGMTVPDAGRKHQARLDELPWSYTLGRQATEHSTAWGQRMAHEIEARQGTTAIWAAAGHERQKQ